MRRGLFACFLLWMILIVPGCRKETEEDRVKKVVTSVQKAAEEKKIMAALEHLSRTYRDPQGYDYDGIKGLLAFYFFRHPKVRVYIPSIDVTVTGQVSTAVFEAVLTGAESGDAGGFLLPASLGVYRFDVSLHKEQERWKVVSAKWERIGDRLEGMPNQK